MSAYTLPDLFVCHACEKIGPRALAAAHCSQTGHPIVRLSRTECEGVRVAWAESEDRCVRCGAEGHDEDGCAA